LGPKGEDEPKNSANLALMPFWLDPKVNKNGLQAGDNIEFDLQTDWDTEKPVLITAIKKLGERDKADLSCP